MFGAFRVTVFFVIHLKSRAVHLAGARLAPDGAWMMQQARNLLDPVDGFLRNATHLVHDRDPLFTQAWTELLKTAGVESVRIPASSPNCNPYAERFVRTVRSECLDHFVIFGERHLRHLLREFVDHYNTERYHQGLAGRLITQPVLAANDNAPSGPVERRSRLGGLLNFYYVSPRDPRFEFPDSTRYQSETIGCHRGRSRKLGLTFVFNGAVGAVSDPGVPSKPVFRCAEADVIVYQLQDDTNSLAFERRARHRV